MSYNSSDYYIEWKKGATIHDNKIDSKFYVKDWIGRGGMGEVWLVENHEWGIQFAVKNPRTDLIAQDSEIVYKEKKEGIILLDESDDPIGNRFRTEFRNWIKIPIHTNIVTCFYAQELVGLPRIFIEYINGTDLKEWIENWLKKGKVKDWKKTILSIAIQIANGMACAHKYGLIHRDLNPKNILIELNTQQQPGIFYNDSKELVVKITDFGLVKKIMQDGINLLNSINKQNYVEEDAQGWGTPEYMPPEQSDEIGYSIDKAADVYSYGVLLFEMVAEGRRPYELEDHKFYKQNPDMEPHKDLIPRLFRDMHSQYEIPSVEKFRPDCPTKLSLLIRKCLEKRPEKRWDEEKKNLRDKFEYFEVIKDNLIAIYKEEMKKDYLDLTYHTTRHSFHFAYYLKGLSLCVIGGYKEAIEVFNTSISMYKDYAPIYNAKGIALIHLGKYEEAIEAFNKSIFNDRDFATAYNNKGIALLECGKYEEAIEAFNKSLEKLTDKTNSNNIIGVNVAGLEKYPNYGNICKHTGDCYERLGNYSKATFWHNKATDATPPPIDKDIRILSDPSKPKNETTINEEINSLMKEGYELAARNKFRDALYKFESALTINSGNADAYLGKCSAFIGMGQYKNAFYAADEALKVDPNNSNAIANKGYIFAAGGKYEEAIKFFNTATTIDPKNVDAWYEKGNCYSRMGRKKEAKECFNISKSLTL